jgi:hypothetical protein
MPSVKLPQLPRRYTAIAATAWLGFVGIATAANSQQGFWWKSLGAICTTLAGFGFAVGGLGVVITRWQQREYQRRTRLISLNGLVSAQVALQKALQIPYDAITPLLSSLGSEPVSWIASCIRIPADPPHFEKLTDSRDRLNELFFDLRSIHEKADAAAKSAWDAFERSGRLPSLSSAEDLLLPLSGDTISDAVDRIRSADAQNLLSVACDRLLEVAANASDDILAGRVMQSALNIRFLGEDWENSLWTLSIVGSPWGTDHLPGLGMIRQAERTANLMEVATRVVLGLLLDLVGPWDRDEKPVGSPSLLQNLRDCYVEVSGGKLATPERIGHKAWKDVSDSTDGMLMDRLKFDDPVTIFARQREIDNTWYERYQQWGRTTSEGAE